MSKSEVQRALNDLRAENVRLQRDNEVVCNRIADETKRAIDQENAFNAKKIEVAKTEKEIEELLQEVEGITFSIGKNVFTNYRCKSWSMFCEYAALAIT